MSSSSPLVLPPTCGEQSRAVSAPLAGTAAEALGWLVVEQPGPWGHDAVLDSDLDRAVARTLAERVTDIPVRIQIVRRPGHRRSVQRAAFLAHAGPEHPWLRRVALADTRELLDLDVSSLLSPAEPALGEPEPAPLYLVCTHAKRDRCCARWGRPVVSAIEALRPRSVWESSHVGGHRFAANVVVLPHGLTYGYLDGASARRVVEATDAGAVDLATFRGRSSLPPVAQAAEVFAREDRDEPRLDAVRVRSIEHLGNDVSAVELDVDDERLAVTVRWAPLGIEVLAGCDKPAADDPGRFELVDVASV